LALVVVGAGGALGAVLRYYVTDWVRHVAGAEMPWGTLVWLQSRASSAQAREFLAIGFLGSFTTFSTYSYETVALARAGEVWRAGGYALGSLVLGVLAVFVGASLATVLTRGLSG
jgi:CrcB protein